MARIDLDWAVTATSTYRHTFADAGVALAMPDLVAVRDRLFVTLIWVPLELAPTPADCEFRCRLDAAAPGGAAPGVGSVHHPAGQTLSMSAAAMVLVVEFDVSAAAGRAGVVTVEGPVLGGDSVAFGLDIPSELRRPGRMRPRRAPGSLGTDPGRPIGTK